MTIRRVTIPRMVTIPSQDLSYVFGYRWWAKGGQLMLALCHTQVFELSWAVPHSDFQIHTIRPEVSTPPTKLFSIPPQIIAPSSRFHCWSTFFLFFLFVSIQKQEKCKSEVKVKLKNLHRLKGYDQNNIKSKIIVIFGVFWPDFCPKLTTLQKAQSLKFLTIFADFRQNFRLFKKLLGAQFNC